MKSQYVKAIVNLLFTLLVLALIVVFVPRVWHYFIPFIVAWILSICASPIVLFLEKHIKIKRKMGSAIVIVFVIAILVFIFYLLIVTLIEQVEGWMTELPNLLDGLNKLVFNVQNPHIFNGFLASDKANDLIRQAGEQLITSASGFVNNLSTATISGVGGLTKSIPLVLIGLIVALFSSYFMVAEKKENDEMMQRIIPAAILEKWKFFKNSVQEAIGGYIIAQFKIIFWIFLILIAGLLILQVKYALVIALIIACLDFLPILGAGLIMVPWAVISFLYGDVKLGIGILIIWAVAQTVRQLIQPKYVGDSIGLKPLPTMVLLYFGYCIGGMAGLILSIPIGYVCMNMVKAGAFSTTAESIRVLAAGFQKFRRFDTVEKARESQETTDPKTGSDSEKKI